MHSAAMGQMEVAKYLIDRGADVNVYDDLVRTPLHDASMFGEPDIIVLLISKGAEVNPKDKDNKTPLDYAKTDEIKILLRSNGALTSEELEKAGK